MRYHLKKLLLFSAAMFKAAAILLLLLGWLTGCSSKTSNEENKDLPVKSTGSLTYEVSEDKSSLAAHYQLEHIKEWYPERVLPPPFDFTMDLSGQSPVELWLLRNEIFARNGYLFEDAVLRGYFNQFKWYQPIFEVPEFKVQLNKQEQEFVNKVIALEDDLAKGRYIRQGNYTMINSAHVYNLMQFKEVTEELKHALAEKNFAIVPAKHEQFFHVYDNNHYQYVPNFITTDFYLQVLHKHFSSLLQKVEEDKFIPLLSDLLKNLYQQSLQFEKQTEDEKLKQAGQWTSAYVGMAYSLLTNKLQPISSDLSNAYKEEFSKILTAEGKGSEFLGSGLFLYSQFKPRGNYTKTKELENYFRCVKWLNTAPIYTREDERFLSAILMASFIKKSPELLQAFQTFNDAIKFIVGEEDNLSIANLIETLSMEEAINPAQLNDTQELYALRRELQRLTADRIKPKAGEPIATEILSQQAILFTAGRYTFDAEILSRLIHVLRPEPKRTFPKGLDVFAVLGVSEAESILLNEYNEAKTWKAYPDSLAKLKTQFAENTSWNKNIYTKTFDAIRALHSSDPAYPLFMKTPFWERKNLITSLAAWTELKHDMLLYAEQPYAAQAGEGGGPPPPLHVSYVEPNVTFWEKALELLDFQEKTLRRMGLLTEEVRRINEDLADIANLLLKVSKKQLANERISSTEFNNLSWLGGRVEYLTFRIFGSNHLPEKERLVAVVADVYNYNGVYLEEAVGMVDEIYVIAEINGRPYLTKGAVFSYYEFTSDQPLSDEQWRTQLTSGKAPQRPAWTESISVKTKSLESKPWFSF